MRHIIAFLTVLVVTTASSPATLNWPNPQMSAIEEALYGSSVLPLLTISCAERVDTTVAAQWLRFAYHDMSTHNVSDGSGGLDASLLFELDRPQNVGRGMQETLNDFTGFTTPYFTLADTIAMGVVLGVASCGGPIIPYRAGRINATEAGPATVPEPQQDLQTHIASFKAQGFDQTEMISLVACGHTLGGVRAADFPTIVDGSDDVAPFDSTIAAFDTNVITQYLAGTSVDPLVVTPNITTQSDLRIFSSDGNVTMQSLATMEAFNATCGSLLERMINTVPKEVTLTDPIEPIDNKVVDFSFYTKNGSYVMDVALRRPTRNPSATVTLHWLPRNQQGSQCPPSGCSVNATSSQVAFASFLSNIKGISTFTKYLFTVQAPLNASISKFWFVVNENNESDQTVVDNNGAGYTIDQDTVLYDPVRTQHDEDFNYNFVVAVRNDSSITAVSIDTWINGVFPSFIPTVGSGDLQLDSNHPPVDGYNFFSGTFPNVVSAIHVDASIDGRQFKLYREQNDFIVTG